MFILKFFAFLIKLAMALAILVVLFIFGFNCLELNLHVQPALQLTIGELHRLAIGVMALIGGRA